jgi:hypothetical protein
VTDLILNELRKDFGVYSDFRMIIGRMQNDLKELVRDFEFQYSLRQARKSRFGVSIRSLIFFN